MSDQPRCRKCSTPIEQSAGKGRPAAYCGIACRRLAEFEVRRLTRLLEGLEEKRIHLEQPSVLAHPIKDLYGRTATEELDDLLKSMARVENRLRALLGAESEERTTE